MPSELSKTLLEEIMARFERANENSEQLKRILTMAASGAGDYSDAQDFAIGLGSNLSEAYGNAITSEVLPNGKLYYNIAKDVIQPSMEDLYSQIADVSYRIQENLNLSAGLGLKAVEAEMNQSRIDGIIDRVSSADSFSDISWILESPIVNFAQSVVDDSIQKNCEAQSKAGLNPVIRRTASGKCCKWCQALAGTYKYPDDVPKDVYRRHENCRCKVVYDPGDGKVQDVHSKEWRNSSEDLEERKKTGLRFPLDIQLFASGKERREEYGDNWEEHSLQETVQRFLQSPATEYKQEKGKLVYSSPETAIQIWYDVGGDYFRIYNSARPGKKYNRKNLDINGNDINNVMVNGKMKGLSDDEFNARTHFRNSDNEKPKIPEGD